MTNTEKLVRQLTFRGNMDDVIRPQNGDIVQKDEKLYFWYNNFWIECCSIIEADKAGEEE